MNHFGDHHMACAASQAAPLFFFELRLSMQIIAENCGHGLGLAFYERELA